MKKKFRPTSVGQFGKRTVALDESTLTTVVSEAGEPTYVIQPLDKANAKPAIGRNFAYVNGGLVIYGTVEAVNGGDVSGPRYSLRCRHGERGRTPVSSIQVWLSNSEFSYLRDHGWPSDVFAIACICQGVSP